MDKHGSKWFTVIGILIVIIGTMIYLTFKSMFNYKINIYLKTILFISLAS